MCYREAAAISGDSSDWHNLAVLAVGVDQTELAIYSLEQMFHSIPTTDNLDAWYILIRLVMDVQSYPALKTVCETPERDLSGEELQVLLESGIYLLKAGGNETMAAGLVRRWLDDDDLMSLTVQSFSELDGKLDESYQRVESEFSEAKAETAKKRKASHFPKILMIIVSFNAGGEGFLDIGYGDG